MAHITIGSTATFTQIAVGGSSTTNFTIPFEFFDEADLDVYDGDTLKTLTTDYTVTPDTSKTGGYDGGTVVLNTGVTNTTITIALNQSATRSSDFPTTGPFNITTLNTQLDKLVVLAKQFITNQARKFGMTDSDANVTDFNFPTPVSGRSLKWKSDLTGLENSSGDTDAAVTASAASAAAALVSENAAAADLVLTNADVVSTNADVVSTAADLVATNQDTIDTAADLALTNADVVLTGLDVIASAASAAAASTSETNAAASATTAATAGATAGAAAGAAAASEQAVAMAIALG